MAHTTLAEVLCMSELSGEAQCITEGAPPYRIVHVNSAWCICTGFTADQVIGQTCKNLGL